MYDPKDFTYGVELEYGNCRVGSPLPEGAKWNDKDNTCVSSTGIANDPLGKLYAFGGEINTKPTATVEEQVEHINAINAAVPEAIVNYRSNLHIHVRVPGLKDDLEACKKLLRYIDLYQTEAFGIVETIPIPNKATTPPHVYEWEMKRAKRRMRSHQYCLPVARVQEMLAATTTKEFYEAHAPLTEKGTRMWYFSPRAGINLRQMWEETETIEFRHFPGTKDPVEMESCIRWCKNFLDAALNYGEDVSPRDIFFNSETPYTFPDFQPYEYETEQVYQWTNFDSNSRKEVEKRLTQLRARINIDDLNVSSKEVFAIVQELR